MNRSLQSSSPSVIFVTGNAHKLSEMQDMLSGHLTLHDLGSISWDQDIQETGDTFAENAQIKAKAVYHSTGLSCLADDSGLVVPALDGQPGIYSARYAGTHANDATNTLLLLERMALIEDRRAYFVCHLHLIWQDKGYDFEGICHGHIATMPQGSEGFGYDPIFIPHGHDCTMAQLSPQDKNSISHRYNAVQKMISQLPEILGIE